MWIPLHGLMKESETGADPYRFFTVLRKSVGYFWITPPPKTKQKGDLRNEIIQSISLGRMALNPSRRYLLFRKSVTIYPRSVLAKEASSKMSILWIKLTHIFYTQLYRIFQLFIGSQGMVSSTFRNDILIWNMVFKFFNLEHSMFRDSAFVFSLPEK